jgi:putative transcriptional regulator
VLLLDQQQIGKGKLLVAMPTLNDPNFWQSVVLLCNYGPEGALGVVLNRPTEVSVSALTHDFPGVLGAERVYEGGPVSKNGMLVLCRGESSGESSIVEEVSLAKDLEFLRGANRFGPYSDIRCYLGYAGWMSGQLEAEVKTGAWRTLWADPTLVFDADPGVLWSQMMRRLGPEWAFYATMPINPSMN